MTFSEFGRRAQENGSKGTDHGSGAPMFLVGGKVKAGVVGEHPSLTKLEDGNLIHATDFRQVYAAVLDKWLGVDARPCWARSSNRRRCLRRRGEKSYPALGCRSVGVGIVLSKARSTALTV